MNSFTYFFLMLAGMLGYAGLIYRVLCRGGRERSAGPAPAGPDRTAHVRAIPVLRD